MGVASAKARIRWSLPSTPGMLPADMGPMAMKFTPAGGQVQISLQPEPADENAEPGVRCLIEDSGPGIPAEYKSQIFDRFVRINAGGAQVRGTGLGLTFCKLALEAHGGRIWVEDSTEGGSRFVFIVPGVPLF